MSARIPSPSSPFAAVTDWIFDLDNTLYPAHCNLFRQIDARMTEFVSRELGLDRLEARKVQKDYYVRYGTTLSGLMREHDVAPHDFMDYVHDIDLAPVDANHELVALVDTLPGRKFIFTNGSVRHAENVISKLGFDAAFDAIFDIADADFTPKPHRVTYDRFAQRHGVDPRAAAMFEDLAQNLAEPHAMGMATVLVASDAEWLADEPEEKRPAHLTVDGDHDHPPHVHHVTDNLTAFLRDVATDAFESDEKPAMALEPKAGAR